MILRTLSSEAKRLVTPELASGEVDRWPERAYASHLGEMAREVDLDAFDDVVDRVIESSKRFETGIDAASAPGIHRALPLTRREAMDPGVWRFLTVVHQPEFVRHRWKNSTFQVMRSRFWAPGTRPDSNALGRLWWIAELTRQRRNYELTEKVLKKQALATNIFVREISWYRPAVAACARVLGSSPIVVVEGTMRRLTKTLSTVVLESLGEDDLVRLMKTLRGREERATR